jgi:prephenate dehydrogenase
LQVGFRTISSNKGLYEGKTNIICEVERTAFKLQEKALELLKLWDAYSIHGSKAHDKHIAYVSHSHISAFMLGKTVINKENTSRIYLTWQVQV